MQISVGVFLWMDPAFQTVLQDFLSLSLFIILTIITYFFWQLYHVYFYITMETLNCLSPIIDSWRILPDILSQGKSFPLSTFSDVEFNLQYFNDFLWSYCLIMSCYISKLLFSFICPFEYSRWTLSLLSMWEQESSSIYYSCWITNHRFHFLFLLVLIFLKQSWLFSKIINMSLHSLLIHIF